MRNFEGYAFHGEQPDRGGFTLHNFDNLRDELERKLERYGIADAARLVDPNVSPPVNVDVNPVQISDATKELVSVRDERVVKLLESLK